MAPTELQRLREDMKELKDRQEDHEKLLSDTTTEVGSVVSMVQALETRMDSLEPVLVDMNGKLGRLIREKEDRDLIESALAKTPGNTLWRKILEKGGDTLATAVSGGLIAFAVWLVVTFVK